MKQMLSALLVLVFFHASVQAADKIRITVSGLSGQFMTFPLAQKRGFLKEEGLDAEIIRITGAASRAALSSGEVDYGTGLGSNIGLAMTGLPIKVVACYVPAPVLALVSRAEVKTVQALRGKTVGILVFGGVAHFAARTIAKHFGLNVLNDLNLCNIPEPLALWGGSLHFAFEYLQSVETVD